MMWIWLLLLIMSVIVITVGYYSDIEHGPAPEDGFESSDGIDFWEDDL